MKDLVFQKCSLLFSSRVLRAMSLIFRKDEHLSHVCIHPTMRAGWGLFASLTQVALAVKTASQCRRCKRHRFDPWYGKIPWRRPWQPTLVSLPGEFHGQRSLAGYSPWGCKQSGTTEWLHFTMLSSYIVVVLLMRGRETLSTLPSWWSCRYFFFIFYFF